MRCHQPIWSLSPEELYETLATGEHGLSSTEAAARLADLGANELPEHAHRSLFLRFADQLTHFMALLLWVAGILAFVSGTPELGWAIWTVIWINALFSFWQEFQAERALAALKNVLPAQVKVYRDHRLQMIPARDLVPGDLLQLEAGDRISADARLVAAESFYADVSVLTGESLPVARHADPVTGQKLRPAEVSNLVFAGSTVAAGRGRAVVYATGDRTEFGHLAHLTAGVKQETSTLEVQIARIVRVLTAIAIGTGILVFLLTSQLLGLEVQESFIFAIGILVALIPEGLLPTVTLALAIGVRRMARQNALVRRLSAVETLSATTVICTDKTGTLTKNEMTVRALWIPSTVVEVTGIGYAPDGEVRRPTTPAPSQQIDLLLIGAALCSNAQLVHVNNPNRWQEIGDPTEAALLVAALKAGLEPEKLHRQFPRIRELPFDSGRRMMTVVLRWQPSEPWPHFDSPYFSTTKGAPVEVVQRCRQFWQGGQCQALDETARAEVVAMNNHFADQGYRVLAVAGRWGGTELLEQEAASLERNLIFIGLVAMFDPPRLEVAAAIARCYQAGIAVTMVTGDHGLTAAAIARQIGLVADQARVVTGEEMGHLSDAQLRQILHRRSGLIFARVAPEQKLRLVQAYKDLGHIVAVTGDGVNDAPALRAANIGIAMGISGTDVAREAADIVLIDDNFATIVGAVEQGRAIYQNIRKFMTYILASNVPEVVPFLLMVLLKIPPALVIMQILAIDLGTDMIPALALGAEPPEIGIMQQPPRSQHRPLLDRSLIARAYGFLGPIEALAGMSSFFWVWWSAGYGLSALQAVSPRILAHSAEVPVMALYAKAMTLTLATIVACQVGNVFACRSERGSSLRLGLWSNRLIWLGIAVEWLLIYVIIYFSPLQRVFSTAPLALWQWLSLLIWPPLLLAAEELRKGIFRKQRAGTERLSKSGGAVPR